MNDILHSRLEPVSKLVLLAVIMGTNRRVDLVEQCGLTFAEVDRAAWDLKRLDFAHTDCDASFFLLDGCPRFEVVPPKPAKKATKEDQQ